MSTYNFYWKHENHTGDKKDKFSKKKSEPIPHSSSTCYIEKNIAAGEPVRTISGTSVVHPSDNFDRKIGLFESFKKAAAKLFTREERKEAWTEFLEHHHPTPSRKKEKTVHHWNVN